MRSSWGITAADNSDKGSSKVQRTTSLISPFCRPCKSTSRSRLDITISSLLPAVQLLEGRLLQVDTFTAKRYSLHWINWVKPRHTHTQGNLQKTRHTRPSSKSFSVFFVFLFFSKHTDMATAAHIGYSSMHSRLMQPAASTPRAHGSNLQAELNTIAHSCSTASTIPFEPTRKAEPTWWQPQVPLPQSLTRLLRLSLMGLPNAVGKLGMA
jgi:hypothetical protein